MTLIESNKKIKNGNDKQQGANIKPKLGWKNSLKNGQELPRFAPDSDEQDLDVSDDTDDLSPYDKYTEDTITDKRQEIASANIINDLNDYRIYLANVNEFLQKFYKDQPYSENLDIIMRVELPKEFEEVMVLCKRYDSILAQNAPSYEQVLLFDTDIFSKFLKIRKETASYKERKELKAKIENKIGSFIEYAFSVDLQQEFLE